MWFSSLWRDENAENHLFKCATDRQKSIYTLEDYAQVLMIYTTNLWITQRKGLSVLLIVAILYFWYACSTKLLSGISHKLGGNVGNAVSGTLFKANRKTTPFFDSTEVPHIPENLVKECNVPVIGVTTTIKSSSKCIGEVNKIMPVVVVGDLGSPRYSFNSTGLESSNTVDYLSLEVQRELFPELVAVLPVGSFSRKNIGYIRALQTGACYVWDFDDENCPTPETVNLLTSLQQNTSLKSSLFLTSEHEVVNPYLLYGSRSFMWPRGYPFELIDSKDFPRLLNGPEGIIDVVQVMQTHDPDVDANWRLLNSQELPFTWTSNSAIDESLITIDASRWAPFNAQATLLSRRAVRIALLPHTVHGRVADIWRSYFMQYLMKRFDQTGFLAFSGGMVDHHRNSHSIMADRQAESQLYDQVMKLVKYLDTRPISKADPMEEFLLLIDDAHQRGFVEAADVQTALVWAQQFGRYEAGITLKEWSSQGVSYPIKKNKAGAVLHVNHGHIEIIPTWMALHSHKFQSVYVYSPLAYPECPMVSGIEVRCISGDVKGLTAYSSMVHAIESFVQGPKDPTIEGFVFLHDDVVWRKNDKLDGNQSYCVQNRRFIPADSKGWYWTNQRSGTQAMDVLDKRLGKSVEYFHGQADEFYVAVQDFKSFIGIGSEMVSAGLFLEIAVPTIFASFLGKNMRLPRQVGLLTYWDQRRTDFRLNIQEFCAHEGTTFSHPYKLSASDGILAHLTC